MQQGLIKVKSGEWDFDDLQEHFSVVMGNASELGLPGVRAFNCLLEGAVIAVQRGDMLSWRYAEHVRIYCIDCMFSYMCVFIWTYTY